MALSLSELISVRLVDGGKVKEDGWTSIGESTKTEYRFSKLTLSSKGVSPERDDAAVENESAQGPQAQEPSVNTRREEGGSGAGTILEPEPECDGGGAQTVGGRQNLESAANSDGDAVSTVEKVDLSVVEVDLGSMSVQYVAANVDHNHTHSLPESIISPAAVIKSKTHEKSCILIV